MKTRSFWPLLAAIASCTGGPRPPPAGLAPPAATPAPAAPPAGPPVVKAAAAAGTFPCGSLTLTFGSTVPPDVNLANQTDADCYAWQEFIALNWPAAGGNFGAPGDLSEVQWQGYMDVHQLFRPGGKPPPPWGTPPQITPECQREARLNDAQARAAHPLVNATKFSSEFLSASDTAQAFPSNAPAWIGDAAGHNVWFEVRVNQDEYDFVVQNQFYDARKQLAFYTDQNPVTTPLQLPAGCAGPSASCPTPRTGAIELKAAWMEVPNPTDARWNNYKVTSAVVIDPATQRCEQVTVALVALHVVHKTQSQPTWIWATFEHKNNAPDDGAPPGQTVWNFNNPQCAPQTVKVPAACQYKNQATVTTACAPNLPPQYEIGGNCPASTPTQVTRINPIDPTAKSVNAAVQAAVGGAFAGSVWQNYELVNAVWTTNPPVIPPACAAGSPGCQGTMAPQLTQSMNPSGAVANTVLETYVQDHFPSNPFAKSNCIICHQSASVPGATSKAPYAADFSFALGLAKSPVAAPARGAALKVAPPGKSPKIRDIFR